jgi:NAD(P)-dependent dehydrogenase (short-subunit alcohol dehydrogenase family)
VPEPSSDKSASTVSPGRGSSLTGKLAVVTGDIAALRSLADRVEQQFGKIDIVVADAAIQRWKPLLEMESADWRDVIDNNLNGTANTIRAFAPKMVKRKKGGWIQWVNAT